MCRLFGMSGGTHEVQATFWLLDAPTSLLALSETQPDGVGLGTFNPDGSPWLYRKPVAANRSQTFITDAHEVKSRTFLAHIRHATAGEPTLQNTHPFEQPGRLFAPIARAGQHRLGAVFHARDQADRGARRRRGRRHRPRGAGDRGGDPALLA